MSSVVQKDNQKKGEAIVLHFPAPKQILQRILDEAERLEPTVIESIEGLKKEEHIELWGMATQFERHGWFLKDAICADTWNQTETTKRGKGNKDVLQKGLLAAVSRRAKEFGITPSRVYQKARIFRLIIEAKKLILEYNILTILDEEGYWEQALLAADPMKAVLVFAEQKTSQKRFRVTDAERLVLTPNFSRKAVALKAVEQAREETGTLTARQALIKHIRNSQEVIQNLIIPSCPDEDFKSRVWEETLLSLEDEYQELFEEDAFSALRTAWSKGHHREDHLAETTGLPIADVSKLMKSLCDMSEFIPVQVRDMKKRTEHQLWHKVGEPFDNTLLMPMKERE